MARPGSATNRRRVEGDTRAGWPDDGAARLDDGRQDRRGHRVDESFRVLLDGRHRTPVVGNAKTAAEIDVLQTGPVCTKLLHETRDEVSGLRERFGRRNLRPDVHVNGDELE